MSITVRGARIRSFLQGVALAFTAILGFSACVDPLEVERHSEYSHIRIRRDGDTRSLHFVLDSGREVIESKVDLSEPQRLMSPYARFMFASYIFNPEQTRVVIIGLGGGAMVKFLEHHDPELLVEAVDIDPVIVQLADELFDVRTEGNTTIVAADGLAYIRGSGEKYDVIYMDAFLKPSEDTDSTGVPQRLKTLAFYEMLQSRLTSDGVVVFNLNQHSDTEEDLAVIESAFPHVAVFSVPHSRNLVVVGHLADAWAEGEVLRARARELDERFDASFSFEGLMSALHPRPASPRLPRPEEGSR